MVEEHASGDEAGAGAQGLKPVGRQPLLRRWQQQASSEAALAACAEPGVRATFGKLANGQQAG